MTFIIGVCEKDRCYISADNMLTLREGTVDGDAATSLGQVRHGNMNDTAVKIFHPFASCIVGIAGSAEAGMQVVQLLKDTPPESFEAMKSILATILPCESDKPCELIIGSYDKTTGSNKLIKWSNRNPCFPEEGGLFMAGSGTDFFQDYLPRLSEKLKETGYFNGKNMGAALSTILNQALVKSTGKGLSDSGVGGCFFSIGLHGSELFPQMDTAVLYVELLPRIKTIGSRVCKLAYREGILFIDSPFVGRKILASSLNTPPDILKRMSEGDFPFDPEDVWNTDNVQNLEIHFRDDSLYSQYISCKPGEFLSTKDGIPELSPKLLDEIEKMVDRVVT